MFSKSYPSRLPDNETQRPSLNQGSIDETFRCNTQGTQGSAMSTICLNQTQEPSESTDDDDTQLSTTASKYQSVLWNGIDATQDDEQSRKSLLKKDLQIQSKYKFLPKVLLNPQDKRIQRSLKRSDKRNHTKKCKAFNRFHTHPDFIFKSDKKKKRRDRKFLNLVEACKKKRPAMICVCEERRCSCLDGISFNLKKFFHAVWRLIYMFLCPPWPTSTLLKLAFWPPPREYFFFHNSNKSEGSEAAQTAPIKIRKASRYAIEFCNNNWRFGFEHECVPEITKIRCFVVETSDKHYIGCVFIKSPRSNPRYTLLFSHPNGSDISDHLTGVPKLHDTADYLNCNICTYDYSGYGISTGKPSETNAFRDIDAVHKHLRDVENIPDENIILWGSSIGTAITVHQALQLPNISGVILFSPPTSMIRTLCWKRCCCCQQKQPCSSPNWRCNIDKFDTLSKISRIKVPLLICHGIEDELVPIEHGQALFDASQSVNTPLWVAGVGHNNLENSELVWMRVRDFLNKETRCPEPRTAIEFTEREFKNKKKGRKKSDREKHFKHKSQRTNSVHLSPGNSAKSPISSESKAKPPSLPILKHT
ncbi:unnamed protein product [Bursaphelenchus xylophilus]|uniref:(pine wood nematode) hypothetical protein n=1 Tax=Bursaphelenchus xylophilus TaxID=6326 RepID=A0A1I7RSP1_BURXY|nr:unnamed protein product [Bursaphelenchus xylophilus]CAG9122850.1 unnamed protein product [Bursaphelenchus xylophilus]